jgi:hypothetical protein
MAQGQAAGTLAAMAAAAGQLPREVPFTELKTRLLEDGVYLGEN